MLQKGSDGLGVNIVRGYKTSSQGDMAPFYIKTYHQDCPANQLVQWNRIIAADHHTLTWQTVQLLKNISKTVIFTIHYSYAA